MSISAPFIRRPVGTTLLAVGLFLTGAVAYAFLPVSSMPAVDFPTIRVTASLPGADPSTMAATVAAPLERQLGAIAGVTELTSSNSQGNSRITVQFDLSRDVDAAARDVQAAINAALSDLPDLPSRPSFRKFNPAAAPILILALTSDSISPSAVYDIADSVIAQRIAQVEGVADVAVSGAEQPAIRVRVNPAALAAMGLSIEQVRRAVVNANAVGPLGTFESGERSIALATNAQLASAPQYDPIVVKSADGNVVRLSSVATIEQSTRNSRQFGWYNGRPAILLIITKQADANVIETVDRIHALLPELKKWIPAGIDISVLSDRTGTIRASVEHMQATLAIISVLVMLVVLLFLRRAAPMIAAGVTVPLALAGTCIAMWLVGFSINNLSLMALAIAVGFVVDDAIVMIENVFRNLERGLPPMRAAFDGARQIGFTVVSISISLVAAFIPLLFMGGLVGSIFREFSLTLTSAILISMLVSLTVTPMICAHFVRRPPSPDRTLLDRLVEGTMRVLLRGYAASLGFVLRHRVLGLIALITTITLTAVLYDKVPKGYFPRDDTGLVFGITRAAPDISFQAMVDLQQKVAEIVRADPAVAGVGSSVGSSGYNASVNRGRLFISLKPPEERDNLDTMRVVGRLRAKVGGIPGLSVFMVPAADVRVGGRGGDSDYQFTLWGPDFDELQRAIPKVEAAIKKIPGIVDVSADRESAGLQADVIIDREAAARLGVRVQDINTALNNSFSQRQVSTIYGARNQYQVVLEVDPRFQRDPSDLERVYVPGAGGVQVPLSAVARFERGLTPLVVNHQGQYPSVTVSFGLEPDKRIGDAIADIEQAVAEQHLPDTIRTDFAGDAQSYRSSVGAQPLLLLGALLAVYIVLGILYESLAHPLTIISTLPSAGLGALLALILFNTELTMIAFIGIILLIGIVKKNGIMMVDFALEGERKRGLDPERAIYEACLERFRPILMTTLAAMLGAVPLAVWAGPGAALRQPLGLTIIGGLLVSQVLTLYTTPVIYLMLDRLHRRLGGGQPRVTAPAVVRPAQP